MKISQKKKEKKKKRKKNRQDGIKIDQEKEGRDAGEKINFLRLNLIVACSNKKSPLAFLDVLFLRSGQQPVQPRLHGGLQREHSIWSYQ